ncbi:MAG TPA: beta-hydroxyacyl-ACP dehydratase [Planctomycetes bacterium]|nr:beta-hydroxyacyl-ACP dehydratase [Planctomycetota bacterium]
MPQLLLDLDTLDLSKTVFTVEDMHKVLSQRGRFSLMDGVCYFDRDEARIVAYKEVRSDEWWAKDHIPGRPIFPGVLMCEAAAQLGTFDFFARRPDIDPTFVGFTGIDKVRFRAVVEPPCRFYISAVMKRVRNMRFTYACQGIVDGKIVFDGELTGMAL